jgi:hypothetical protein
MIWVFAAVVLCLAVAVPGFRKLLLILGAIIVCIVLLIVLNQKELKQTPSTNYQPEPPTPPAPPPKLIPPENIEVRDIRSDFSGPGGRVSNVTVRLFNKSPVDTLGEASYRLTIADCKIVANKSSKTTEDCATVDDKTGSFRYLEIPPQQARDDSLTVQGFGVTILGSPRITIKVTSAQAK